MGQPDTIFRYSIDSQDIFTVLETETKIIFSLGIPAYGHRIDRVSYDLLKRDDEKCRWLIDFLEMRVHTFLLDNLILLNEYSNTIRVRIGGKYLSVFEFILEIQDDTKRRLFDAVRSKDNIGG